MAGWHTGCSRCNRVRQEAVLKDRVVSDACSQKLEAQGVASLVSRDGERERRVTGESTKESLGNNLLLGDGEILPAACGCWSSL